MRSQEQGEKGEEAASLGSWRWGGTDLRGGHDEEATPSLANAPLAPTASPHHLPVHTWKSWNPRTTKRAPSRGRSPSPRRPRASSTNSLKPSSRSCTPSRCLPPTPCCPRCPRTRSSPHPSARAWAYLRATSRGPRRGRWCCSHLLGTWVSWCWRARGGSEGWAEQGRRPASPSPAPLLGCGSLGARGRVGALESGG